MLTGPTPILRREALIAIVAILLVALTVAAHAQGEGRKPDSDAKVAALIRQLQGSDAGRREQALDALLKMEPMTPAAIAVVAQAMKNPDDTVRQYAVQVLEDAGPDAIPALTLAIDDQNQQVRVHALDALGEMARPRQPAATTGLGPEIWPILIRAFKDEHEDVRRQAASGFYRDETAAVPLLRHALNDSDPKVRLGAAKALRQIGPDAKDASGDLVLALKDPDKDVRDQAITTLIDVDPTRKEVLPILIQRLEDPDPKVRGKAVEHLERMKSNAEAAVPALAHLLATQTAPNMYPHLAIIYALENIGTANAAPVLAQVLSGELVPAIQVRTNAVIGGITMVPAIPLPQNAVNPHGIVGRGPIVPPIRVPRNAGMQIGVVGRSPRVEEDPQAQLRRSAASAIGRLGANGVSALPALERALNSDKDPKVRLAAGRAIGELGAGGASAVPTLTQALTDDKETEVRIAAARSIGKLGPAGAQGLPALLRALSNDKDPDVRIAAVKAMEELGPSAAPAIPALVNALGASGNENNSSMEPLFAPCLTGSVREVACATLAELGKPAIPALSAALQSPDAIVRYGAAEALARDSVSPLPSEVVNELTVAMKDKDSKVRHDAAMALDVAGGREERAADAELDRDQKADTAKERAQRYNKEEILGPAEVVINDQKYAMQLDDSLPVSLAHDRVREAKFLVTIHRGTTEDKFHFAPQRLAIWKTTGDNKFQLVYAIKANLPDLDSWMDAQFDEPTAFKSEVLVTGEGKDHYETGLFVNVPWESHGGRSNQVFALDPATFGEVKIEAADEWYAHKLRPEEFTPNYVQNDFSDAGLNFKFGIHGYGDMGWHDASAGEVSGTYKIVKEMRYDKHNKNWTAAWKMVVNTAKREPFQ
jgi:HEAT repeat protein